MWHCLNLSRGGEFWTKGYLVSTVGRHGYEKMLKKCLKNQCQDNNYKRCINSNCNCGSTATIARSLLRGSLFGINKNITHPELITIRLNAEF